MSTFSLRWLWLGTLGAQQQETSCHCSTYSLPTLVTPVLVTMLRTLLPSLLLLATLTEAAHYLVWLPMCSK